MISFGVRIKKLNSVFVFACNSLKWNWYNVWAENVIKIIK